MKKMQFTGLVIIFGLFFNSCETEGSQTPTLESFSLDSTDAPFYYSQTDSGFTLTATFMNSFCSSFDPDLSGDDEFTICVENQPLSMGLSETFANITFEEPGIEISRMDYIDTLCVYSDTISDSVVYTYKVNYHPDSVYPAGYFLQINNQSFIRPHEYGEQIDPSQLDFTTLETGIGLSYSRIGSTYISTPGLSITSYSDFSLGPWMGAGKKCIVFKFTGTGNHIYYGWIELEMMNAGTLQVYSIYCHQLV